MATEKLHVYTVCFPAYDSTTQLHGCLYNIRRNFFENGVSEKKVITDYIGDVCTKYSYYISQWGMGWKKTVDGHLLEYSVSEPEGCSILFQDSEFHHYEKIVYDSNLEWVRTYYYDKYDDAQIPAHSVEMIDERGILLLRSYDKDGNAKSSLKLYPGYSEVNSEINDLLDKQSGKPIIYATTSRGEVCFCTAEQAKLREDAMETIEPAVSSLDLEDVMVSTFDWDERGAQLFAECVLLLRGADAEAKPEEVAEILKEVEMEANRSVDVGEEYRRTVEETEAWIRQLSEATQPEEIGTPSTMESDGDLFSYSSEEIRAQDDDLAEIMAMIQNLEEKNKAMVQPKPVKLPESEGKSLYEELESLRHSGQKLPSKYTVAGKKINSKMVHATEVFDPKTGTRAV